MAAPQPWQELARVQYAAPGTTALVDQLSSKISRSLLGFGPKVISRVHPSVEFGVTTFAPERRPLYAWGQGYLIAWVFALDHLLDDCLSYTTANDLQMLIERLISKPPTALCYDDLALSSDPAIAVPNVGYSILDVLDALHLLRCHLYQAATDVAGPQLFDRYLADKVVKMMVRETAWRLHELPTPTFANYIDTATTTICGGLCVAALNAVLPYPLANWQAIEKAAHTMCRAVRLINDLATQTKDDAEGTPNAVTLLTKNNGSHTQAAAMVHSMVDEAAARLRRLCMSLLRLPQDEPLHILGYYTFYSWVMTEAMYSRGDFLTASPVDTANERSAA